MTTPDRSAEANVGGWIRDRAALHPDRTAVAVDGASGSLSYGDLARLSNRLAHFLSGSGVRPGDRVALALGSDPLYLGLYFAAAKIGAILVPLNTRLTEYELSYQLQDSDPSVIIRDAAVPIEKVGTARVLGPEEIRALLPRRDDEPPLAPGGEAPQVLLYTSGTTGVPKGAVLPHRKTVFNTLNAEIYFELHEDDVVIVAVPLFHSYGLKILSVPALFTGASIVLVNRFDPVGLQETVARHRGTLLGGVPIMYQRMVTSGTDAGLLKTLRLACSAGAPLDPGLVGAFGLLGVPLIQAYGQTETSILCCLDGAHAHEKAGSVGRPVRHGEVRIVDPESRTRPAGTVGEIVVRGPIVMQGYWRRAAETEATRLDDWHRTGDFGRMDEAGFVTLVGRTKEMYISGGENVYPAEIERVLEQHENVLECAVIGVPDEEWGETGHAYVVPDCAALSTDELRRWARERLAGYKIPKRIYLLTAPLPRTASGKVQKLRLKNGAITPEQRV